MDKKCTICGKSGTKKDNFCELCGTIMSALYAQYTTSQLMAMYSHVLGIKLVQNITDITYDTLKSQYESEKLKEKGKLN